MTKKIAKMNFVGRAFTPTMIDEDRSFASANKGVEEDQSFQNFLKENQLEDKRASMVVFGPENFMYWYGVLVSDSIVVPNKLMKFALPAAEIAEIRTKGNIAQFDMPLNYVLPDFFNKIAETGIEVFENPGDSPTPYYVQTFDGETLKQFWYVKA